METELTIPPFYDLAWMLILGGMVTAAIIGGYYLYKHLSNNR
ncbi:hypothetical protein HMPREF0044_0643 [Gleimia coleocanis DSM 15436]|uniref:Uncharacterized protein n=1 Tax=Gleimia coleocanis DSM 15436 TaxID=525245 RepID=C0W0Q0_9ACTO|nr:hypothetical protein [Gleimia coleocanis]EEH63624.1 hypothetical protein HMPREF0044_0643 [Gleimia coleocanis DSM 15436]